MGRPKKNPEEPKVESTEVPSKLTPEQQERKNKLLKMMNETNKELGGDALKFAVNEPSRERYGFGHPKIDEFTGGGTVAGNINIIWGSPGVGKTSLILMQIAEAQKKGKSCMLIDMEHSFSKERALLFGVNLSELVLVENVETAEQAMNTVIQYCKANVIDYICVDSIHAMSPKAEQVTGKNEEFKDLAESEMALLARLMAKFARRVGTPLYNSKATLVLIGQVRTGGLGSFAVRDTLTGGNALKFFSVLIMYLRKGKGVDAPTRKETITDDKGNKKTVHVAIGHDCVFRIDKTKISGCKPEGSEIHVPYVVDKGFLKDENKQ